MASLSRTGAVGYSPNRGQKGMVCPTRTGGALFGFAILQQHKHPLYPLMVDSYHQTIENSNEAHGSICMGMLSSGMAARHLGDATWTNFRTRFFPQVLSAAQADGSFKFLKGKTFFSAGFDEPLGNVWNSGIYSLILQLDNGALRYVGQRHG